MRLDKYVFVGQDEIQAAPAKINEEKRCEAIDDILGASCVGSTVKVTYLQDGDKIDGFAIKRNEGQWMVLLNNNKQFLVDPIDLQEPSKCDIVQAPQNLSMVQNDTTGKVKTNNKQEMKLKSIKNSIAKQPS
jgi:hypothetical protein